MGMELESDRASINNESDGQWAGRVQALQTVPILSFIERSFGLDRFRDCISTFAR